MKVNNKDLRNLDNDALLYRAEVENILKNREKGIRNYKFLEYKLIS